MNRWNRWNRPDRSGARPPREAGFSFVEILVVMGIIAVLVGIGIGVYAIVIRKTPELKARTLVNKLAMSASAWKRMYRSNPPSDLNKLPGAMGVPLKITGRLNGTNQGIEALYQALFVPGFDASPDTSDSERSNYDEEDRLDAPITKDQNPSLFEFKDAWEHPVIYFSAGEYESAEKSPPTYVIDKEGTTVQPKPWRTAAGGFCQPDSFQVFSLGPDGLPNTEDDVKAWEN